MSNQRGSLKRISCERVSHLSLQVRAIPSTRRCHAMSVLRFSPLQSQPTSSFWTALTSLKLDRLKLDDSLQEIQGWIRPGSYARPRDGETNAIWIGGLVMLDASSLNTLVSEKQPTPAGHLPVRGVMKNFNTIEEFKDAQTKKELLKDLARETDQASTSSRMSPFLLVTFADLKKYVFHYWFAFPTTVQKPAWESDEWVSDLACRGASCS